jgi:hypothetical protein
MRLLLVAVAGLLALGPAPALAPLLGLLTLPRVFGEGACDPTPPRPVALHDAPSGTRIGEIRTLRPWRIDPNGGCSPLEVRVLRGTHRDTLPTLEVGYEESAVIVTGRVEGWYRIRLSDGEAWVADSTSGRFVWYAQLVAEGMAFVTEAAPAGLAKTAGSARNTPLAAGASVRVTKTAEVGGALWFEVEVLAASPCGDDPDPATIARGWLPAHDAHGEPTVWFHSRGC